MTAPAHLSSGEATVELMDPDQPTDTALRARVADAIRAADSGDSILRGLAARAPYFHNGLAKDLNDAVEFYDTRFGIDLTAEEKADLVAFLRTL